MQGQPNLNCKQMEEALDAYYDLELSAEEAEAVELHLADCAICTARLADIDMVVAQLKSLPAVEWSGDLSDAIEARILAQAPGPQSNLEPNAEPKVENIVSINSESRSQTKSQPQSNARSSKVTGFFKPRYILASAASLLALFFAYSQFASTPSSVTKVAQTVVPEVLPVAREFTPKLKVETVRQVASTPEKKDSAVTAATTTTTTTTKLEAIKVASKPDLQTPPKVAVENTATKKMLANSKQGTSDHNSNNVDDSEEIVAVYDYDTIDSVSDFGISTNEDGLYAIKL